MCIYNHSIYNRLELNNRRSAIESDILYIYWFIIHRVNGGRVQLLQLSIFEKGHLRIAVLLRL